MFGWGSRKQKREKPRRRFSERAGGNILRKALALGWRPTTSLHDAFARTLAWFNHTPTRV
jgi:nucleoside-diphosphate-sugar epimerase